MFFLLTGLVLFFGAHVTPTLPAFRASLIEKFGLPVYKLAYATVSLVGLVLIIHGASSFRGSESDAYFWSPPLWTRHIAFTLMLPAFILLASAYIPSKIREKAGHPMLAAIMLWALAHLLANGDLLALLLFGSFLAFAFYDRVSVSRRRVAPKPPAKGLAGDLIAVVAGTGLWAATLFWLHGLAGAPLLP